MEAGIGGQSLYYVGCILFSEIENQKKAFNLKNKIQIQNTDTKYRYKYKIQSYQHKQKQQWKTTYNKQQTTNIIYKLLMMIDDKYIHTTHDFWSMKKQKHQTKNEIFNHACTNLCRIF